MNRIRKTLYKSRAGRYLRNSRGGILALEVMATGLRRLPVPRHIFSRANKTWRRFYCFEGGSATLPQCLSAEFNDLLEADQAVQSRVDSIRERCPKVGMVFSSGRAGTRGLSLYLARKDGLTALHRPGDVPGFESSEITVDPGERNSIVYRLMLGPRDREWWERQVSYVLDHLEFAAGLDAREFWLTAHRWNCYFPIFELVLGRQCPALLLDRDDRKIIHSMITRNQYCPADSEPDDESTWVNVEPQLIEQIEDGAENLKLTGAPLFDRVAWYVQFVRFWFEVCASGRRTDQSGRVAIDDLAGKPEESLRVINDVVGLPGETSHGLKEQFNVAKNTKPRSTQTGLRFPEPAAWPSSMNRRLAQIQARWKD